MKNNKMKSIFLIVFAIALILGGCSLSRESSQEDICNEVADNSDISNYLSEGRFNIPSLPGNIEIMDTYNVYSLDNEFTEEMCQNNLTTYDTVKSYLGTSESLTNTKMIIIPKGGEFGSPNFSIEIKVKENKDYGMDNFKGIDENMFTLAAKSLVAGFGCSEYSVVEEGKLKYVVFDPNNISNQRRYATIINGKMVYIIAKYKGSEISENENLDLKKLL